MSESDAPFRSRAAVVVRGALFAAGVGLAAVGVWLIVTGKTQQDLKIGALAGFWGLLLGASAAFGRRQPPSPDAPPVGPQRPGSAVELRGSAELERVAEAAARREHEARLENLLRQEVRAAVHDEVCALRAEIAELRSDLVEKVGGQLRLERIETTRVIGSDLEALQHEVRQLKAVAREAGDAGREFTLDVSTARGVETAPLRHIVEAARTRPVTRETAATEADIVPARQQDAARRDGVTPASPARAEKAEPAPLDPASMFGGDDLAALPRIRPFTDFELDPVDSEPSYSGRRRITTNGAPTNGVTANGVTANGVTANGVTANGATTNDEAQLLDGRHSRTGAAASAGGAARGPGPEPALGADVTGGDERAHRRARGHAAEDGNDLLARLLARESSRR